MRREVAARYGALTPATVPRVARPRRDALPGFRAARVERRHRAAAARVRLARAGRSRTPTRRRSIWRVSPWEPGARRACIARCVTVSWPRGVRVALHRRRRRRLRGPRRRRPRRQARDGGAADVARSAGRRDIRVSPQRSRARATHPRGALAAPARNDGRTGHLSRRLGSRGWPRASPRPYYDRAAEHCGRTHCSAAVARTSIRRSVSHRSYRPDGRTRDRGRPWRRCQAALRDVEWMGSSVLPPLSVATPTLSMPDARASTHARATVSAQPSRRTVAAQPSRRCGARW